MFFEKKIFFYFLFSKKSFQNKNNFLSSTKTYSWRYFSVPDALYFLYTDKGEIQALKSL